MGLTDEPWPIVERRRTAIVDGWEKRKMRRLYLLLQRRAKRSITRESLPETHKHWNRP
jgi:hypothetical protein